MKRILALLASAAFASAAVSAVAAPALPTADRIDPSIPTQLPRTAVPHHYAITVTPHADRLTFDGRVAIDLDVVKPTRMLVLNAAELQFHSATLTPANGGTALSATVATDAKAQTAALTFPRTLAPGSYRLDIAYSGPINTQANGLFALDYTDKDGKAARALFTQFEPSDARRFFPSWDEPVYKATFDLAAVVPAGQMAVSNMPAASSRTLGDGLKEVRFQTTPRMSSYLLFFGTGDFDRVTKRSAGREVGVVMSRGNGSKATLALDDEAEILPYYNSYFGVPFPLPKLDNVAGPGQSQFFSAMENWGAIFTFERSLLVDPAISSQADRERIFGTEAHEMAHQWFGDLVTMDWWSDIWLNEGFASWMANKATQHFHPDWGADVDHVAAREGAMGLDALASTHPIVQDVRTVEQANQVFDAIAYSKGESVLSMLETYAGPKVWQAGIQRYIRAHAYHNARTPDLWAAQEAAGAKGLTAIATDFTTQPGIPLITVGPARCDAGSTVASLTQTQFSADRQATLAKPLLWHVPVRASAGSATARIVTSGRTNELRVPGCGPLLINAGQTGYFRTLYTPQEAAALQRAFPRLGPVDQFGLMADSMALSTAGYQPMATGLDFLAATSPDDNDKVVSEAVDQWDRLYDLLDGNASAQSEIAARVIAKFGPRLAKLGFAPRASDSAEDASLRPSLIETLGKYGDPAVVAEAKRLFAQWLQNPDAIPGPVKNAWLGVIARNADAATWDALRAKARAAGEFAERTTLYQLLGSARDEALAQRTLALALTDEPGKTVSAGMITSVAAEHPRLAIQFVLAHLDQVNQLIDSSGRSQFMRRLAYDSHDPALIPVLERYAAANLAPSDRKPVQQSIDRIRFESSQRPRIESQVMQWLQAHRG